MDLTSPNLTKHDVAEGRGGRQVLVHAIKFALPTSPAVVRAFSCERKNRRSSERDASGERAEGVHHISHVSRRWWVPKTVRNQSDSGWMCPELYPEVFFPDVCFVLHMLSSDRGPNMHHALGKDSTTDRTVDSGWGEGVSQTKPTMMGATEGGTDQ